MEEIEKIYKHISDMQNVKERYNPSPILVKQKASDFFKRNSIISIKEFKEISKINFKNSKNGKKYKNLAESREAFAKEIGFDCYRAYTHKYYNYWNELSKNVFNLINNHKKDSVPVPVIFVIDTDIPYIEMIKDEYKTDFNYFNQFSKELLFSQGRKISEINVYDVISTTEFDKGLNDIIKANSNLVYLDNKGVDTSLRDKQYRATAYVCEYFTDIDTKARVEIDLEISFGYFKTQEEAENIANQVTVSIYEYDYNKNMILVSHKDKQGNVINEYEIKESDIIFKQINEEKRIKMGKPLDLSDKANFEIIQQSLDTNSKYHDEYMVKDEDMEIIDYDLEHFLKHYSHGQELQNIAYGYLKI